MATEQKIVTLEFPLEYWENVTEAFAESLYVNIMVPRPMVEIGQDPKPVNKEEVTIDSILEFIRVKTKEYVKRKRTEELLRELEADTELESNQNTNAVQVKTV